MLNMEVQMKSNVEKLQEIRNLAIMNKSNLQFGLTSLLLRIEYGVENTDELNSQEEQTL